MFSRTSNITAAFANTTTVRFVTFRANRNLTSFTSHRSTYLSFPSTKLSRSSFTPSFNYQSISHKAHLTTKMVATSAKSVPGVLDTDEVGGVLMAPRDGSVSVTFAESIKNYDGALLVLAVHAPEDDDADFQLPAAIKAFEDAIAPGVLSDVAADAEFKGKTGSSTDIIRLVGSGPKRVVLYGLGKKSNGVTAVSEAAKFAIQKGITIKSCSSVGLFIDDATPEGLEYAAEGANVGAYIDERYKEKKDTEKVPGELVIVGTSATKENETACARGKSIAAGVITAKDLINAPANTLTPATLAAAAEMIAKEVGLEAKIMGRAECEKLGMGSYLGVGRAATDEPKFIHLTYKPSGPATKKICLVGKAVTFDTGGTNLKAGAGSMIELMKFDMGGSAVCLGAAKTVGALKPEGIEVHFIMPAVENMIGDRALHPGDIVKASNGKTIEVINTDAEGRLCLADALVYAENLGDVDYVVDLATLTGAIIVSLGKEVAGFWSSSDELADALNASSKAVGEKMWRMPLVDEYVDLLKSRIADLRNIGTDRGGSSIQAALFLREFVKTKNWAHIDIAGTVWSEKKGGATGWGVKTMTHWVETLSAKK